MPTYNKNAGYGQVVGQWPYLGTGKVFVVGKSGLANRDTVEQLMKVDPDGDVRFFSTLAAAKDECTDDAGDTIYVLPGHTETLTGAAALTLDASDVTIQGLGNGDNRPTFLLDASAAVDIAVSADDVKVSNLIFKAGHADIVNVFDLGAAKNFTVENCKFIENASNENFKNIIVTLDTANANDGLTVKGCTSIQPDTANVNFIQVAEDIDSFVMEGNYISMGVNNGNAVIGMASGKDLTNARIKDNEIYRLNTSGDLLVDSDTTNNTGIVACNYFRHADTGSETLVDLTGAGCFENYASAADDASGYLLPAADS